MSQQLVKKGANGRMEHVNPKSWIEAIKDKNTGQTLVEILQGFNMYFLPYNGNTSSTRCLVPTMLRKKGLWITYVKFDKTIITEWYAGEAIDDITWQNSVNWKTELVTDVWMNYRGYTNERPSLTLVDNGYPFYDKTLQKYICWNGTAWTNLDGTALA